MAQRILIAPLDWGLGHTARCIPLILKHIHQGDEIVFAGTKQQHDFIKQHQINVRHVNLFGYSIHYSSYLPQWLKIALQVPKILISIKKEKKWLDDFLNKEHFDLIISDNRYGLFSDKSKSVILSHQLAPESPILNSFIQKKIAALINKFDECWIPDDDKNNYSGKLSYNKHVKISTKKIGIISRLKPIKEEGEKVFDVLILLSGIEPQRSILEKKLVNELKNNKLKICLVRGTTNEVFLEDKITIYNKVNSDEINELIHQSKVIICRSGYTSIMELLPLKKKIILIPTPGQTEQEYLAKHIHKKFDIEYLEQKNIHLITTVPLLVDLKS
jgi:uncharacterized protein (TIGR00661 family)